MSSSVFQKIFPVPKYLQMPTVGLDISDLSAKYVQLKKKNGVFVVEKFNNKAIAKGLIENGEIIQKEKLVEFLKALREEIGSEHVIVSLPEEKGFISRIELPAVKDEEVRGALELQLENYIPISGYDAVFDYGILENNLHNKKNNIIVDLTAFPATLINDYRDVLTEAGFKPLVFEMETSALARAVVKKGESATQMIVDFGKTRTSFIINSNHNIQFTSTINVGGDSLTNAIAKDFGVDFFEAERIKKEYGFIKSKEYEKFFNSLLPTVGVINDEMNRHINFWNTHMSATEKGDNHIKKIILSGGDSSLTGFSEFLSYQLRMPVEIANPWINIVNFDEYIPEIDLEESLAYSVALGLALRSF